MHAAAVLALPGKRLPLWICCCNRSAAPASHKFYGMAWHGMPHGVGAKRAAGMPCSAMLWHPIPCTPLSCHAMPGLASCHGVHGMPCHDMPCHVVPLSCRACCGRALSQDLNDSMLSHLKLHFNTSQRNDEAVLGAYPSTIRRRVLRYMYLDVLQARGLHGLHIMAAGSVRTGRLSAHPLPARLFRPPPLACDPAYLPPSCVSQQSSQLFDGARQRFLDALLAAARVEVYLPNVSRLASVDCVCNLQPAGVLTRLSR